MCLKVEWHLQMDMLMEKIMIHQPPSNLRVQYLDPIFRRTHTHSSCALLLSCWSLRKGGRVTRTRGRADWLVVKHASPPVRPDGNWDSQLKLKENSKSCWCIPCQPETWQPGLLSCLGAKLKQNLSVKIYTPSRMWYFYRLHYIYIYTNYKQLRSIP